jgi:hypothetical protein
MIKNVFTISCFDVDVKRLFNLTRDVITYCRDRLNSNIIETIMMIKYNLNNIRFINENEIVFLNDDESFVNAIAVDFCDDLSVINENDENDENDETNQDVEKNENNDRENIAIQDHNVEKIDERQKESFLNHNFINSNSSLNALICKLKQSCRRDVSEKNIDVEKHTFNILFLLFSHKLFSQISLRNIFSSIFLRNNYVE